MTAMINGQSQSHEPDFFSSNAACDRELPVTRGAP